MVYQILKMKLRAEFKTWKKTMKKPATRGLSKTVVRKMLAYTITATGVEIKIKKQKYRKKTFEEPGNI